MTHKTDITLADWRPEEHREDSDPASVDLTLRVEGRQVLIEDAHGRSVMVELEAGDLRVHGYNRTSESPATLNVPAESPIIAEDADHLLNKYGEDPSP
jgi:hypothetical protein